MTSPNDALDLYDVLSEYASQPEEPSHAELVQWIKRYPQFRQELTELTLAWTLQDELPPAENAEEVDTETLVLWGMSVVEDILHQQGTAAQVRVATSPDSGVESLLAAADKVGLNLPGLADRCNLSISIMVKLNRRLIEISSIPAELVQQIANALRLTSANVNAYFQRPTASASGAYYRASSRPVLSSAKANFFEVVRADLGLSDTQRVHWLALQTATEH
tara:strand:+ start:4378 stop:5037 length:660 start_codon:yes stop_codon:yes gene_type:complete